MRTWRTVTNASLIALALGLALILSTPLRFPGYIIGSFGPVLTFLVPGFTTWILMVSRLVLPHRSFAIALLVTAIGYSFLAIAGAMAIVILLPSLLVLLLMYLASKTIPATRQTAAGSSSSHP